MSVASKAKAELVEIEEGVVRFLKATADLFHEGAFRALGEVFPAFSHHPATVPASGDAAAAEAERREQQQLAFDKANTAQSGVAVGGDRIIYTARGDAPPALPGANKENGADLV